MYQTITFIMKEGQELAAISPRDSISSPWLVGVDEYTKICSNFQANNYLQNLPPKFLLHFPKQQENSIMMLASTQDT